MNFLNVMLLGGGLAFSVPLLIHLLRREKFRRIDWGAMLWLDAAKQTSSRAPQWSTLLLLLNRVAIPVFLAMALAQPVLTSFRDTGASGSSLTVLIDNSLSMSAQGAEGSALQLAKELVDEVLRDELTSGNLADVTVFTTTSDQPLVDRTLDIGVARSAIRSLGYTHRANQPAESMRAAVSRPRESNSPSQRLLVVSDFQASRWASVAEDMPAILRAADAKIAVTLAAVAANDLASNVSVHLKEMPRSVSKSTPLRTVAVVSGLADGQETQVLLSVDGTLLRRETVIGGPAPEITAEFACQFTEPGQHIITAQVDVQDTLADDNTVHHVLQVVGPLQIGLIADDANPAAAFIATALAPFGNLGGGVDRFQVTRLSQRDLTPERLEMFSAVVAAPEQELSLSAQSTLAAFIELGGGLVVFPTHEGVEWNGLAANQELVLPYRYAAPKEVAVDGLLLPNSLPAEMRPLRQSIEAALTRTRITKVVLLEPHAGKDTIESEPPQTILLGSNGPLIAARAVQSGVCVQFAFSPAPDWTNLQLQPAFVPMLQEIVGLASASKTPRLNWFAGEAPPSYFAGREAKVRSVAVEGVALERLAARSPARVAFEYAGLYRVASVAEATPAEDVAIKIRPEESSPKQLSAAQLGKWAESIGASRASSADQIASARAELRDGKGVWRWFLIAVLCLLVSEIWLSGQITRGGQ